MLDRLLAARRLARSARLHRSLSGARLDDIVEALSRLWHAIIIVDRFAVRSESPLTAIGPGTAERLREVRRAACCYLDARARGDWGTGDELRAMHGAIDAAAAAVREEEDARALEPLAFSLGEIGRNLEELHKLLDRPPRKGASPLK